MTDADWQFTTTWRETPSLRWMGVDNYTLAKLLIKLYISEIFLYKPYLEQKDFFNLESS